VSGTFFNAPVNSLFGKYIVYGLFPTGAYESPPFNSLKEARAHLHAMGCAYLKIKLVDPSDIVLNMDVPDEGDPGSFNT